MQTSKTSIRNILEPEPGISCEALVDTGAANRAPPETRIVMSIQEFQRLKDCEEKRRNDADKQIRESLETHGETLSELARR